MRYIVLFMLCLPAFAEDVTDVENAISRQNTAITAQRLNVTNAAKSLNSNRVNLGLAKLPQDIADRKAQLIVSERVHAEESAKLARLQGELSTLTARLEMVKAISVHQSQNIAPIVPKTALKAPSNATIQPLFVLTMKDGSVIKCVRYVRVDDDYSLQMPDKTFKQIPKDSVRSIAKDAVGKVED